MVPSHNRVQLHVVQGNSGRQVTDAELACALMAGQEWAFAETWNRFAPLVHALAGRALGNEHEAEDLTQEVFYRFFARVHTLKQPDSLRAFVVSFAVRILKWKLRSRRAGRWLIFLDTPQIPDSPFCGADPEARDILRRFYAMLDRMNTRERLVFTLRRLESMTLEEVAAALQLSLSTIKRSYSRAEAQVAGWIASDPELSSFLSGREA
jgi:RNA polymerase sigma-70 factor (ECF subfamily)